MRGAMVLVVLGLAFNLFAVDMDKMVNALILKESQVYKGKYYPNGCDFATGDEVKVKGKTVIRAKGCLQIWEVVVKDVNAFYGTKYTHDDMFDRAKAKDVCKKYLVHYAKAYERKTGKKADEEILARIWNGGPKGYVKAETAGYWLKLKRYI